MMLRRRCLRFGENPLRPHKPPPSGRVPRKRYYCRSVTQERIVAAKILARERAKSAKLSLPESRSESETKTEEKLSEATASTPELSRRMHEQDEDKALVKKMKALVVESH